MLIWLLQFMGGGWGGGGGGGEGVNPKTYTSSYLADIEGYCVDAMYVYLILVCGIFLTQNLDVTTTNSFPTTPLPPPPPPIWLHTPYAQCCMCGACNKLLTTHPLVQYLWRRRSGPLSGSRAAPPDRRVLGKEITQRKCPVPDSTRIIHIDQYYSCNNLHMWQSQVENEN